MDDFVSLGSQLREAREARELSLYDVEKQTRIRLKYLQAIEYGNFQFIDTPTQLRGFLRKYARAVGLDDEMVLAQYETARHRASQKRGWRRANQARTSTRNKARLPEASVEEPAAPSATELNSALFTGRRRGPMRTVSAIALAILLTGLIVGGLVITLNNLSASNNDQAGTSEIQSLPINNNATNTPALAETQSAAPTPQPTLNLATGDSLFINLTAEQRLWVQVEADGAVQFEGVLRPGDGWQTSAADSITVRTSNAGGLRLVINNQPYSLGDARVAAEQTFTVGGFTPPTAAPVINPTLTNIPTLTITAEASTTATITNTASPEGASSAQTTLSSSDIVALPSPTSIPTLGFASSTPSPTTSPPPPTAAPTLTPSPLLPPRATRTPTVEE
ncbi:MAG: helix-turn-helix domain-containing protein [Chloroflexi bacterium]|nr:helix-turn-helix domain-containing protein [Chloroflexota bacterium]